MSAAEAPMAACRPHRSPAPARRGLSRGFTLIEIMLAVAILGVIMVMLAGSFHAVAAGKTHAEGRLLSDRQARAVLAQLSNELRGAVQTPLIASAVVLIGQGRMQSGAPLDNVIISTLDPGHRRSISSFGAEELISYAGQPNPQHRGWYMLMRQQRSALLGDTAGIKIAPPMVLAANVLAFHVRYFNGNIWLESWDSGSLPPGSQLPQAVAIDLVMAGPGGAPVALSTQVTLPMAFTQW
ncbi:MAG TPA: prepilin-type N-terminal cleavage/methylation domain-containing protein [Candidatus Binataceae bacterium]|nr:prepilin-type N-terminal cleavage/methylation domain-containing protein [Candidatus Binataceae bacterium]HVB79707.1 prepilin-type N-terminal cleavage/methylation domain-containing protein [Candidatus Binataceae bacterium]